MTKFNVTVCVEVDDRVIGKAIVGMFDAAKDAVEFYDDTVKIIMPRGMATAREKNKCLKP